MEAKKMEENEDLYLADLNLSYLLYGKERQDQIMQDINEMQEWK